MRYRYRRRLLQLAWSGALEIIGIRPEIICVPILPSSPPEATPPSLPLAIKALDVMLTSIVTIAVLCAVIVLPILAGALQFGCAAAGYKSYAANL